MCACVSQILKKKATKECNFSKFYFFIFNFLCHSLSYTHNNTLFFYCSVVLFNMFEFYFIFWVCLLMPYHFTATYTDMFPANIVILFCSFFYINLFYFPVVVALAFKTIEHCISVSRCSFFHFCLEHICMWVQLSSLQQFLKFKV